MMKDNFSNPNPFLSHAKQFQELVNQPTAADAMAGAFSKGGSQPAQGPQQRGANAFMNGIASGIQGAENQRRQEKLSPILEQAGQITAKAAELEAQAQQEQGRQFAVQEYGRKYTPLVATFADLVDKGDPRSSMVFKDLISKAGSIPGYENLEAESWDASKGYGLALNTKTGEYRKITADEIISVIAPSAQAIYGDKWFEKFLPLNAGVAKDAQYAFNTNRQATELGLTEKRADIANKYSQANVHNTQAEKTKHEMENPEKPYNKELANHNLTHIKDQRESYIKNQALVATLNDLEGFIKEANKKGQAGSTVQNMASRAWAKYYSGDNKDATLADMAKAAYFSRVKEGGGSNPSTTEFLTVLETIPNIDKNSKASLDRLALDRKQALNQMYRYKKTEEGLRKSNYQGSPDDEAVFKHNDDEYKTFSKQYYTPKVTIQAPDGTIALVSPEYADDLVNNKGGKVIDE